MLKIATIALLVRPLVAYTNSTGDTAKGRLCVSKCELDIFVFQRASQTTDTCINQCQALFQTSLEVVFPNTTTYEARIDHIWSVDAALPPSCFVLPASTEDASLILQLLTQYQCPFGMVSGGHTDYPGGNSIENGVTVDFG